MTIEYAVVLPLSPLSAQAAAEVPATRGQPTEICLLVAAQKVRRGFSRISSEQCAVDRHIRVHLSRPSARVVLIKIPSCPAAFRRPFTLHSFHVSSLE